LGSSSLSPISSPFSDLPFPLLPSQLALFPPPSPLLPSKMKQVDGISIPIPLGLHCLVALNIPSYCGGMYRKRKAGSTLGGLKQAHEG
jgi:hypothetical protein